MSGSFDDPQLPAMWLRRHRTALLRGRLAVAFAAVVLILVTVEGSILYRIIPDRILVSRRYMGPHWVEKNIVDAFFLLCFGFIWLAIVTYAARNETSLTRRGNAALRALPAAPRAYLIAPLQEALHWAGALLAVVLAVVQYGMWQAWLQHAYYPGGIFPLGIISAIVIILFGHYLSSRRKRAIRRFFDQHGECMDKLEG